MHSLELKILELFKKEPNKELPTTSIVREVFKDRYEKIKEYLEAEEFLDKEAVQKARREKGRMHRKLLYHLNKLLEDGILKIARMEERGEKVFALDAPSGEIVIEKAKKKIQITKTPSPSLPIDGYEDVKIVRKYSSSSWINKINSVMLEGPRFQGINKLYSVTRDLFSYVNDAVGVNGFEKFINESETDAIEEFIRKVNIDTKDYNRNVCLNINLSNLEKGEKAVEFVRIYSIISPDKLKVVFQVRPEELTKSGKFIEKVILLFSKNKLKLNLKNKSVAKSPVIIGRAGVYTFDEEEWARYQETLTKNQELKGVSCSHTTIIIDVDRYYNHYGSPSDFRKIVLNAAKSILTANTLRRKNFSEYFKGFEKLGLGSEKEFFSLHRNYIRLWNYDWEEQKNIMELFQSSLEELEKFTASEEAIFKSCGIPIRFKVVFSSTFNKFEPDVLSSRVYKKTTIKGIEDLQKPENMEYLETREKLFQMLKGGDRLRIFRSGGVEPKTVVREMVYLMNSFNVPEFTYDFAELASSAKLTAYFH